jgi:hypothetical protein
MPEAFFVFCSHPLLMCAKPEALEQGSTAFRFLRISRTDMRKMRVEYHRNIVVLHVNAGSVLGFGAYPHRYAPNRNNTAATNSH